jgi:hypothetical protein
MTATTRGFGHIPITGLGFISRLRRKHRLNHSDDLFDIAVSGVDYNMLPVPAIATKWQPQNLSHGLSAVFNFRGRWWEF